MEYQKSRLNLPIVRLRKIWYAISIALCCISIAAISLYGLRLGLDFTGGSLLDVEYTKSRPSIDALHAIVAEHISQNIQIQPRSDRGVIIRLPETNEDIHQKLIASLRSKAAELESENSVNELRFESFGPSIGAELRRNAMTSIGLVMIAIIAYLAYAFRKVSRPVASWKFGTVAVIALAHNVLVVVGLFSVLGHFYGTEVDGFFVTALLTLMGFTVHDTIVTLDRIRENLHLKQDMTFSDLVHHSINETFTRSVNTSTVVLVLISIYFFGGETIKDLALALIAGMIIGTYSSIFIASPLLVTWYKLSRKNI